MIRTLKENLTKLTLETCRDWEAFLPFTLKRVRNMPLGLTPFEIMYGRLLPMIPK